MKLVIQRCTQAAVVVDGKDTVAIGKGAVVLVAVARGDTRAEADYLVRKLTLLRIYDDDQQRLNASIRDVGGSFLVVSQFTLYADCRKGNRPSYIEAAAPDEARGLYEYFVQQLAEQGIPVQTGQFQAHMKVQLVNDGPVTIILERKSAC